MEDYRSQTFPELEQEEEKSGQKRFVIDVLETIILSLILFLGINAISARIRVESISMMPTLAPGDFVIVNRLAYRWNPPSRGDIVVFRLPNDTSQRYIKRVIGLPGETVSIRDGQVYINDQLVDEGYIQVPTNRGGEWEIADNAYFVMGDNRNNSSDSRIWGFVPRENMIGKGLLVYWPPDKWGTISSVAYAAD